MLRHLAGDVLSLLRSTYGACIYAGTATDALVSVDFILAITLNNCFHGASLNASAAGYAIIGNLICHWFVPPVVFLKIGATLRDDFLVLIFYHIFFELQLFFLIFLKKFIKTQVLTYIR